MKGRERFIRTTHFEEPDRVPHALQFWQLTLDRWSREGFKLDFALKESNSTEKYDALTDKSSNIRAICDFFDLDMIPPWNSGSYFYQTEFSPMFPIKIVEEGEDWMISTDSWGIKKRNRKDLGSVPQFLDFPVKYREDFEKIKDRYDSEDEKRYAEDYEKRIQKAVEEERFPIGWGFPGFFGFGRWMMGLNRLLMAFFRDKNLIHEMFGFWSDFITKMAKRALELQVDYLGIWEDMAYRHGPMISPKTFKEFMVPYYKRVTDIFRNKGVDVAIVDSDGDINPLIPLWLKGGVNGFLPLEVRAGVDAISLKEKYGDKIILFGNIGMDALRKGSKAIDQEIGKKFKKLLPGGGYIASTDHHIPADVSYQNFQHYYKRIREWGKYRK